MYQPSTDNVLKKIYCMYIYLFLHWICNVDKQVLQLILISFVGTDVSKRNSLMWVEATVYLEKTQVSKQGSNHFALSHTTTVERGIKLWSQRGEPFLAAILSTHISCRLLSSSKQNLVMWNSCLLKKNPLMTEVKRFNYSFHH